jgi:hypothetical protein
MITSLRFLTGVTLFMLRYSSLHDPIRGESEFIALLDIYESNPAEQRQLLQAMDDPT